MRLKHLDGVRARDMFNVSVALLTEEPGFNERVYEAEDVVAQVRRLADAYKAGEFVPPLAVRQSGETIYIVDGHLRMRGAKLAIDEGAQITSLPCVQFQGDDADRLAFMVTSSQGLPLNPIGRARAYLRMQRLGLSETEIATKVGHTVPHVKNYLTLAGANRDVQTAVEKGDVSFSFAVELVNKHGDGAGAVIAENLEKVETAAATKPRKATKKAKVTRKSLTGTSPQKALIGAAKALVEKHGALKTGNRADIAKMTFVVQGSDLLALFDALPAKTKVRKSA